ncbi:TATA box-binding protein-associated factor RNA polymerase I subunit B [Cyprinodon tularosa]|uniref:TATA box-binding protein-associated factor RNA polymerase I subunit B n=1 Tax=Cyprinodon tularosa TaxID=77115 RepID=UPI0018E1E870|nr:TATA box-binding protein-associated factor RNA polymerase I subunit B [Cyprinodon tularosa]
MDEEDTAEYREPCAQCAAVDWGISDEGRFYCRSCHNVIERTKEVVDTSFVGDFNRISWISSKSRAKKAERCRVLMVCEVFQLILKKQAEALLRLGVSPHFKDEVLCQMWRLYLQKSQQAYTDNPVNSFRFRREGQDSDSDSASDFPLSGSSLDSRSGLSDSADSADSNTESTSTWMGPVSKSPSSTASSNPIRRLLHMRKTLALIHLALVWSREALTLSDLLRLVKDGHVPYVTAYEEIPDEMKLCGSEALLFNVEIIPSYRSVHKEAQSLILFLQLPAFPPIVPQTLLHPARLCLRYLIDANLPDELHKWVCILMDRANMLDEKCHTVQVSQRLVLPQYELQAAALIIVTMKVFFGLDDHTEWDLSNEVGSHGDSGNLFSFRKWYKLVQAALVQAQQRRSQDIARKQWKGKKLFYINKKDRVYVTKRRRISENIQMCLKKLASGPPAVQDSGPSSFQFCWGDEDGSDGPSLHRMKLDGVVSHQKGSTAPCNQKYWHLPLHPCHPWACSSHYTKLDPMLPRSFVWLLELFSFMLDVESWCLLHAVLRVERRVFGIKTAQEIRGATRTKTGNRTRVRTRTERRTRSQGGDPGRKSKS